MKRPDEQGLPYAKGLWHWINEQPVMTQHDSALSTETLDDLKDALIASNKNTKFIYVIDSNLNFSQKIKLKTILLWRKMTKTKAEEL